MFGIPRSASSSHTVSCQSLLIAACTRSAFSGVLLVAGLPEPGSLSTDSRPSLKHLCHTFICAALIALSLKALWITWIVSMEECPSLTQNLMWFVALLTQSFWVRWPHSTQAHSMVSTTATVQYSYHCSRMCIPVLSPWLLGYLDVVQTGLIIVMMAGPFPDRPLIYTSVWIDRYRYRHRNKYRHRCRSMWR